MTTAKTVQRKQSKSTKRSKATKGHANGTKRTIKAAPHPSTTPAKDASVEGWKRALLGICELSQDCFTDYAKTGSEFMAQLGTILAKLQLAASTANSPFELNWMVSEGTRAALYAEYEARRVRWSERYGVAKPAEVTGGAS